MTEYTVKFIHPINLNLTIIMTIHIGDYLIIFPSDHVGLRHLSKLFYSGSGSLWVFRNMSMLGPM